MHVQAGRGLLGCKQHQHPLLLQHTHDKDARCSWPPAATVAENTARTLRSSVACTAASVAGSALQNSADGKLLLPYKHQQQQHRQQKEQKQHPQQQHGERAVPNGMFRAVRNQNSYSQLLALLQGCSRDQITANLIQVVLFQASRLARSAAAAPKGGGSSSSSESLAAQQLVCACLQLLLEVNEQISGWHLSNCLLSLGVLCGRGGPASPVMGGAAAAAAAAADGSLLAADSLAASILQQQQQQQQQTVGVLQQLINPARSSRRDLEALLQATGPQHQLQQLLHLTRNSAIAAAQPGQLVNMLYGLAVLPLRPAPDVLSLMLQGLQDHLDDLGAEPGVSSSRGSSSSSSSNGQQAAAAAATADAMLGPKQLSQLLWAAATLQLHLPEHWLNSYLMASQPALHAYGAQDIANSCWALASLKQQQQEHQAGSTDAGTDSLSTDGPAFQLPPDLSAALLQQAAAVAGSLTAQGVANTLWGLAVLQVPAKPQLLLLLLQRAVKQGGKLKPQEFANTIWGAARCLHMAEQQLGPLYTAAAAAVAVVQDCKQQLQQLLQQFGPDLSSRFLPRDWSNITWGAGLAGVQPGKTLLQALWRKTPAGFSTSLNPHLPLGSTISSMSSISSSSSTAAAAVQAALLNPTRWSPQALANTLWGLAKLRVVPPRVWLQGFEAASVAVLPGFSHQQLANTLWAFAELRHAPSEVWLQLYWQQMAVMSQQPSAAAAAAGGGGGGGSYDCQQQLLHTGQVLQACGRLGVEPPLGWLQEATAALLSAAEAFTSTAHHHHHHQQQQQQQQQQEQLHVFASGVHSLAELAHNVSVKQRKHGSSSIIRCTVVAAVAVEAAQQLLQLLSGQQQGLQQQQQQQSMLQKLHPSDVLALLLALPKLQLPTPQLHAVGAALLLRAQQQQQQRLSASQLAQLAYAAACLALPQDDIRNSTGHAGLWMQLQLLQQQEQQQRSRRKPASACSSSSDSSSTPAASAAAYIDWLAVLLAEQCSSMSAVDLRFSTAAVAKLQMSLQLLSSSLNNSSRRSRRSRWHKHRTTRKQAAAAYVHPSAAVAAFAAAAGTVAGSKRGDFTPHQRSVTVCSLAALGLSPELHWVEMLLHYSSCDLSGCSNGDLVRLLQALPLLLNNEQRQQRRRQQQQLLSLQQQVAAGRSSSSKMRRSFVSSNINSSSSRGSSSSSSSSSSRQISVQQQVLQEWLSDWLTESERRMGTFSTAQVVGMAKGLTRLTAYVRIRSVRPAQPFTTAAAAAAVNAANPVVGLSSSSSSRSRSSSSSSSPVAQARALAQARLIIQSWRQQQQHMLQLPGTWQEAFLQAVADRLHNLGAPELLLLLSAVRRLGLTPTGQDWCTAVAAEAAARAAATAAGTVGTSPGTAGGVLGVHHIGWLALHLSRLGYVPSLEQQSTLLDYIAVACAAPTASLAAAAAAAAGQGGTVAPPPLPAAAAAADGSMLAAVPVPPRQLWQLLVLLSKSGWVLDAKWVQQVQGSAAGQRLRAWLGRQPHLGRWEHLWSRLQQAPPPPRRTAAE